MATSERVPLSGVDFDGDDLAALKQKACIALGLPLRAVSHFLLLQNDPWTDLALQEMKPNRSLTSIGVAPLDRVYVEFRHCLRMEGKADVGKRKEKKRKRSVKTTKQGRNGHDGSLKKQMTPEEDSDGVVELNADGTPVTVVASGQGDIGEKNRDRWSGKKRGATPTSSVGSGGEKVSPVDRRGEQQHPTSSTLKVAAVSTASDDFEWKRSRRASPGDNKLATEEQAVHSKSGRNIQKLSPQRAEKATVEATEEGKDPGYESLLGSPSKSVVSSSKDAQESSSRRNLFSSLRRISNVFSLY